MAFCEGMRCNTERKDGKHFVVFLNNSCILHKMFQKVLNENYQKFCSTENITPTNAF
eukprot:UN07635